MIDRVRSPHVSKGHVAIEPAIGELKAFRSDYLECAPNDPDLRAGYGHVADKRKQLV